jgi:hypothetical protein
MKHELLRQAAGLFFVCSLWLPATRWWETWSREGRYAAVFLCGAAFIYSL